MYHSPTNLLSTSKLGAVKIESN